MARPKKEDTAQQRVSPTVERVTPSAQPMRRPTAPSVQSDSVRVKYKPTGRILRMPRKQAENTVRQSPKNYEIL